MKVWLTEAMTADELFGKYEAWLGGKIQDIVEIVDTKVWPHPSRGTLIMEVYYRERVYPTPNPDSRGG